MRSNKIFEIESDVRAEGPTCGEYLERLALSPSVP